MDPEGCEEARDAQRNTQAGSEPVESQTPFWNIAGVGSGSVVIILERGNLRFGVGWHQAISRIQSFGNIIIDAQGSIQKPFFSWPVLVSMDDAQSFACRLGQERATSCDRGCRAHSDEQDIAARQIP